MNIVHDSAIRKCTSCQMCSAVCPYGAITIGIDAEGFYRPKIDAQKCVDCGLCTKVCYKFDKDIQMTDDETLHSCRLYAASALDKQVLDRTTSGGIADLLAKSLVENGYKCVGVTYDSKHSIAKGEIAETFEETDKFRGSKYIQSYSETAFRKVVEQHKDTKFAIFGTPCQIYAVDKFARYRGLRDNFLFIDLYCHGCPTLHLWQKYEREVLQLMKGDSVVSANFRSKIKGWGGGFYYVEVVVRNQAVPFVSSRKKDEFYTLFFSDMVLNEVCYDCKLRSTFAYTDIRLGDFWGRCYLKNRQGMSGVSIVTGRGKEAFARIDSQISKREHSYDDFLPFQSFGRMYHKPSPIIRSQLMHELADYNTPLNVSVKTFYESQNIMQRFKRMAKNVTMMLPMKYVQAVKYIYYKLR